MAKRLTIWRCPDCGEQMEVHDYGRISEDAYGYGHYHNESAREDQPVGFGVDRFVVAEQVEVVPKGET